MDNTASCMIEVCDLHKHYKDVHVLRGISTTVAKGEVCAVIGPSGSGKSTFLRCLNRLEEASSGEIFINAQEITDPHLNLNKMRENIGMVFQNYAVFPHMNVFDNVAFGLRNRKLPKDEIKRRVTEMLELVNLAGYEKRYIDQLSGGQQQRVAIARALVNEPEVLLLDEPLGALDLKLRKEMQIELKRMQKKLGITFIFVTHDQEEALTMSDTIAVMNHGIIQQIGCPTDVYNEPKNRFVARFIGESNIFEATMRRDYLVNIHGIDYECVDAGFGTEQPVDVVIRPEDVDFVPIGKTPLHGVVTSVLFMGVHYEFTVDCDGRIFKVHSTDFVPVGETVGIEVLPDAIHIMNPERRQPTEAAAEEPQQNL